MNLLSEVLFLIVREMDRFASSIALPLSSAPVPAYKWAIELPLSFHNIFADSEFKIEISPFLEVQSF